MKMVLVGRALQSRHVHMFSTLTTVQKAAKGFYSISFRVPVANTGTA